MNKITKFFLYILSFLTLSNNVSATIYFGGLLNPLGNINIAGFYLRYYSFIDAVIYLLLFLSIAQLVFTKVYPQNRKEAKMIAIAVAISLTFSMTLVEMNTTFYLGQLAPVALILFMITIAMLLFNFFLGLFTGTNGKALSAALTYLIIYGLLTVPFGVLNDWINNNAPALAAVLALAAVASLIYLIIEMFNMMGFKKSEDDPTKTKTTKTEDNNTVKEEKLKDPTKRLNPTVKILEPLRVANKQYGNTDPIVFGFEVSDVTKPFRYVVLAHCNGKTNNVTAGRSSDNSVGIPDLKNCGAGFKFPGTNNYRIILYILNDAEKHILDARGNELMDITDIVSIDTNVQQQNTNTTASKPTPSRTPNFVRITSPISSIDYRFGEILPINFDVGGPDHGIRIPFIAKIYIRSIDGQNDAHNYNKDHSFDEYKNSWYGFETTTLPPGMYELGIKTTKNGRDLVQDYSKVTFRIVAKTGGGQTFSPTTTGLKPKTQTKTSHSKTTKHSSNKKETKTVEFPELYIDGKKANTNSEIIIPHDTEHHSFILENNSDEAINWEIRLSENAFFREIQSNPTGSKLNPKTRLKLTLVFKRQFNPKESDMTIYFAPQDERTSITFSALRIVPKNTDTANYPEILLDDKIVPYNSNGKIINVYKSRHTLRILNGTSKEFDWIIRRNDNVISQRLPQRVSSGTLNDSNYVIDIDLWSVGHNPSLKECDLTVELIPKKRDTAGIVVNVLKNNFERK